MSHAAVEVDDVIVGSIGLGFLAFVGIGPKDGESEVSWMAAKVAGLRVFADEEGRMNRSLVDVGGGVLVVSQFTLYGDCAKGRRPSFTDAAGGESAKRWVDRFAKDLRGEGIDPVATGRFGAKMRVSLVNEGPVTLWIEKEP